jgi:hypothetical protein
LPTNIAHCICGAEQGIQTTREWQRGIFFAKGTKFLNKTFIVCGLDFVFGLQHGVKLLLVLKTANHRTMFIAQIDVRNDHLDYPT